MMQIELTEEQTRRLVGLGLRRAVGAASFTDEVVDSIFRVHKTSPAIPELGQYWTGQGGIRAVPDLKDAEGRSYDLVVVTGADGLVIFQPKQVWGEYGKKIEGADSCRDGRANTSALAASGNSLAKAISETKTQDGQTDCYWPSQVELMGCYIYVPQLFGDKEFWSSSQFGSYDAWAQGFENGSVGYWLKHDELAAFPVRRVYR